MRGFLFLVLFKLILLSGVCFAYDQHQVANGDLLRGVLLGALLSSQKNPNIVNYIPLPYYHNLHSNSGYNTYPPNNHILQEEQHRESNYDTKDEEIDSMTEHSDTVTETMPTELPTTSTTFSPLDNLHERLGLPPHSVIVMMMPPNLAHGQQLVFDKQPEDLIGEKGRTIKQISHKHINKNSENINLKTNAIKVGSKQFNHKGWKPVPKMKITTARPVRDRYNTRPYIENSQFGLRTK